MPSKKATAARAKFKAKMQKAKAIHKSHPGKKWTTCVKEAFKK